MYPIGMYQNGNYKVYILSDGTKIRANNLDSLIPEYPESIDLKITNQCDIGCPMCHENSTFDGKHGDIMSLKFIDTLLPYTELAIGGGNPLSHPDLVEFLEYLKSRKIIANITVNLIHFDKYYDYIVSLCDRKLVYGVGVSCNVVPPQAIIDKMKSINNLVIHTIAGIIKPETIIKFMDDGLKVLVLGYKKVRRGLDYYQEGNPVDRNISKLRQYTKDVINTEGIISFDNLAIEQLDLKNVLTKDQWNNFYMGDDGQFSMYIDAVRGRYSVSSTLAQDTSWELTDNIKDMFNVVRNYS